MKASYGAVGFSQPGLRRIVGFQVNQPVRKGKQKRSGSNSESLPEQKKVGLMRCNESLRVWCPSLFIVRREEMATFTASDARGELENN